MSVNTKVFHLKMLRLRLGWTHFELAGRTGCSIEQLRKWEASGAVPTQVYQQVLYHLEMLAEGNSLRQQLVPQVDQMVFQRKMGQACYGDPTVAKLFAQLDEAGPLLRLVAEDRQRVRQDPQILSTGDELVAA